MKKIISLILCLMPSIAVSNVETLSPDSSEGSVPVPGNALNATAADGFFITNDSANGYTAKSILVNQVNLAGGLLVGAAAGTDGGWLVIDSATAAGTDGGFSIVSTGPINIAGKLSVLGGNFLRIGQTGGDTVDMTLGTAGAYTENMVDNQGKLDFTNIATLNIYGSLINESTATSMNINAQSMNSGAIENRGGDMNITVAGAMNTNGGTIASAENANSTTINAGSLTSGTIQNGAGTMDVTTSGDITINGSLENKSGQNMNVTAGGAITVDGTITQEATPDQNGTLTITGASLTVTDSESTGNPSIEASGNLVIDITGATILAGGFDLSAMDMSNTFSLTTDTLTVGDTASWSALFSNKLSSFTVNIKNGALNLDTNIINGNGNADANMFVTATEISAQSIQNDGNIMNITATQGDITVSGAIIGTSGKMEILTNDQIYIGTSTSGTAISNGPDSEIFINAAGGITTGTADLEGSISNSGTLTLFSSTATGGNITINGNVENNDGVATINARTINITGTVTNNGGTLNIFGSDNGTGGAASMGTLTAAGGVTNIDQLISQLTINGDLLVQKNENSNGTTTGGALNIGKSTNTVTVTGSVSIDGNVTLSASPTAAAGDVNIGAAGPQEFVLTTQDGTITIGGNINATQSDYARSAQFIADEINVGGDVAAAGRGRLIFGDSLSATTIIAGDVTADADAQNNIGSIEFFGNDVTVGGLGGTGLFVTHGTGMTVTGPNGVHLSNGIWMNGTSSRPSTGLVITDTNIFTLTTSGNNAGGIGVGGIDLGANNTLNLNSVADVTVTGTTTTNGTLNITAATINMAAINSAGTTTMVATDITTGAINVSGGTMDITADTMRGTSLNIASGAFVTMATSDAAFSGAVTVNGDMAQNGAGTPGGTNGALTLTQDGTFGAGTLTVTGNFIATSGSVDYRITNNARITGNITVDADADSDIQAGGTMTTTNVTNNGTLRLAGNGITAQNVTSAGDLTLDSGTGIANVVDIVLNGTTTLAGAGLTTQGYFEQNMLYQNTTTTLNARDVNIASDDYTLTATTVSLAGISQESGALTLKTASLDVGGNITATDLTVIATPMDGWLNVGVTGNVSGNTKFIGLKHMEIGGNYTFNSNSGLTVAILPYAQPNGSAQNYWSTVNQVKGKDYGVITNAPDGEPLISVNGKFITDLDADILGRKGLPGYTNQLGIQIFDMIDQGTAIWLLHADGGIEELADKMRNLNVLFCNKDATICFDYYGKLMDFNGADDELPAYITVRDSDGDGVGDDVYIVFDPDFGGPLAWFKIQPIVGRDPTHTDGEYVSAGALDDLIEGQLHRKGFGDRVPVDAIPIIFADTNMNELMRELYDRINYWDMTRDGEPLSRFSRLVQVRELTQLAGSVNLDEHTNFRDFEDHMMNEYLWNRNRNLRQAWGEFDFGMLRMRADDNKRVHGNRFSFVGGYDWQESETLILGLTGRINHTSSQTDDTMDLSYAKVVATGNVDIDVGDTDFGIGGYLMQNIGGKARLYGNAFLDFHWLTVSRDQTFMNRITGNGTSVSLISEWGLMHDWLNQYIIGNLYARVGYNFGMSMTEKADGQDYMKLKSDGYLIATPGYTLIAQKRIYPSVWFQIRPYASIGVEYDVLGAPDSAKYKFAPAERFTTYDIVVDPLWANIGGGMEFLSATGVQIGLDYRYQYNDQIQLHKIKLSGSYRF